MLGTYYRKINKNGAKISEIKVVFFWSHDNKVAVSASQILLGISFSLLLLKGLFPPTGNRNSLCQLQLKKNKLLNPFFFFLTGNQFRRQADCYLRTYYVHACNSSGLTA